MRNKKGDVPWILIMFALALVVLAVMIALLVTKSSLFKKGSEQATDTVYKCFCQPPGTNHICAVNNPDNATYDGRPKPLDCGSWDDCTSNCWKVKSS